MKCLWLLFTLALVLSVAGAKKKKFDGDFEFVDEVSSNITQTFAQYLYTDTVATYLHRAPCVRSTPRTNDGGKRRGVDGDIKHSVLLLLHIYRSGMRELRDRIVRFKIISDIIFVIFFVVVVVAASER